MIDRYSIARRFLIIWMLSNYQLGEPNWGPNAATMIRISSTLIGPMSASGRRFSAFWQAKSSAAALIVTRLFKAVRSHLESPRVISKTLFACLERSC